MQIPIEEIGLKIYREISKNFPVVSSSDEFFYFPQVKAKVSATDWTIWDRFSPEFITEFAGRLSLWENEIDDLFSKSSLSERGNYIKIKLLKKVVSTLREYLVLIRVWETQPTFYLTIACVGMADAMDHGIMQAEQRAGTLSQFLDQAGNNLKNVPACFRDSGLEMIRDTRVYLSMLMVRVPVLSETLAALDRFEKKLNTVSLNSGFRLPEEKLTRVVEKHICCGVSISQAEEILDHEIDSMKRVLETDAKTMGYDAWPEAYMAIPFPDVGEDGLVGLYRDEVLRLGRHCREYGLVTDEIYHANPVKVLPVPAYLSAIRAASSYSITPGHPPSGGVFYVINAHDPDELKKAYNREYSILSAHETWPGHHLLDINRWNLSSPLLRAIEQPVFYEGWACFAEVMLEMTGYISEPGDRLIVAKRRLWRAIRGKVDLGLQTGAMSVDEAADQLTQTGMGHEQAQSSVLKYLLNPGYQLCYTIGLKHFLTLYDRYVNNDLTGFLQIVLNYGEICFEDLEKILQLK